MKIKLGHVSTLPTYIRKTLKADDLKWALINTYSSLILEFITQNLFKCRPVWPDAEIKSGPIFSKFAQNVAKSVFISKGTFFKIAQTSLHIWATFETKYFTQNFRKSPNLVTLLSTTLRSQDHYIIWSLILNQKSWVRNNRLENDFPLFCVSWNNF